MTPSPVVRPDRNGGRVVEVKIDHESDARICIETCSMVPSETFWKTPRRGQGPAKREAQGPGRNKEKGPAGNRDQGPVTWSGWRGFVGRRHR